MNLEQLKIEAENGDKIAQYNLGKDLYYGLNIKKSKKEGLRFLELSSEQGFEKATFEIALYEMSIKNYKKSDEGYNKLVELANKGFVEAQEKLGEIFDFGRGRGNLETIMNYLKEASTKGSYKADYMLSILFYRTSWDEKIETENSEEYVYKTCYEEDPFPYLIRSADAGYDKAQCLLGMEILGGMIIENKTKEDAINYLTLSANNGFVQAKIELEKLIK